MPQISRKCVPFTPFSGDLGTATVALVSAAGVYAVGQEPFDISTEAGDVGLRIIGHDAETSDLHVAHHHYDHTDADLDVNVMFPLDRLRELAEEGFIGAVAREHITFGYSMQIKRMYEQTAPRIAEEIDKKSRADVVVLTGG